MSTTLEAIYEDGLLRLAQPLPLPNRSRVTVTVVTHDEDPERQHWLAVSEAALRKTWETRRTTSSMNCYRNDVVLLPVPGHNPQPPLNITS